MKIYWRFPLCLAILGIALCYGQTASDLRLVPFPKQVQLDPGSFNLDRRLILEISQDQAEVLGEQISAELRLAGLAVPNVRPLKTAYHVLRLATKPRFTVKRLPLREEATPEDYALRIQPNSICVYAQGPAGLFYGAQTMTQLIRANRQNCMLPALTIHDWPALPWRAFQDDLTRGPSSKLESLLQEAELGSFLKLNIFTYYMEHQFAFQKHKMIGPKNGSLTAEELRVLVAYARDRQLNVLGNQQSFGHFAAILAHPEFAKLRETDNVLCPTNAQTYQLLDDLYSEVIPLMPFPYFTVCCDETDGLGEGPSKSLADKIGVGGVYVQHIRRVHDLVTGKYGKRMMMWGDIILKHPDRLRDIPSDIIMLTWGYDPRPSFEDQISPFEKAAFEFLICPGVNNWNRILPRFGAASTNIQNFVRDGIKHHAAGMINTAWDDDGQTFNTPNWPGFAWGAECAWNASATTVRDFDRRLGGVLFGEPGDHFGLALEILSSSEADGMPSSAFWRFSFGPVKIRSVEAERARWQTMLQPICAAIGHFEAAQKQASTNAPLLDFFLYGAQRMQLCGQREVDRLQAAVLYRSARRLPLEEALPLVEQAETVLRSSRNSHQQQAQRFVELWQRENKTYAMDWTIHRFDELIQKYDHELDRLAHVRHTAKPDRSLPSPREVGLELVEGTR
jgi:hypothetical protein